MNVCIFSLLLGVSFRSCEPALLHGLNVLSHLQGVAVMSSTTTINIQNTQAEACNNVMDDYVHVGLSVGDARGGGGGGSIPAVMSFIWVVTKHCTSSFKCTFM